MNIFALLCFTAFASISANQERDADYQEFLRQAADAAKKARLDVLARTRQPYVARSSFHLNRNDLAMLETLNVMNVAQTAQLAPAWFAALAILIVFIGVPLIFACLFPDEVLPVSIGGKKPVNMAAQPALLATGSSMSAGARLGPQAVRSSSSESSAPPGGMLLSPFTAAMSANMSFVEQHRSPESASRAVWSTSSGPPPLCAAIAPAQSKSTFYIDKAALRALYNHRGIEIMDRFSKVAAYATLSRAAGGTRLVVAYDPSCSDPVATVGPLDYPANLDRSAMLHGPHRELYGAFERFGEGFSVSHFSRVGHAFTSSPKKVANGIVVEISAGSTQLASAWIMNYKDNCQIDVNAGMDITLMLTAVLATSVASQHVIDEV